MFFLYCGVKIFWVSLSLAIRCFFYFFTFSRKDVLSGIASGGLSDNMRPVRYETLNDRTS